MAQQDVFVNMRITKQPSRVGTVLNALMGHALLDIDDPEDFEEDGEDYYFNRENRFEGRRPSGIQLNKLESTTANKDQEGVLHTPGLNDNNEIDMYE